MKYYLVRVCVNDNPKIHETVSTIAKSKEELETILLKSLNSKTYIILKERELDI